MKTMQKTNSPVSPLFFTKAVIAKKAAEGETRKEMLARIDAFMARTAK